VGYSPLTVEFKDLSIGTVSSYVWDFGDGATSNEENPTHVYTDPGMYTVSLTIEGPGGTAWKQVSDIVEVYDEFTYKGLTYLTVVEASDESSMKNWENAIDHDTYYESGTALIENTNPWVILTFDDGLIKSIGKMRMMHATAMGSEENYVTQFDVYTSISGATYTKMKECTKTGGDWEDFEFSFPITAKYIKLVVNEPVPGTKHIGEFQVYEKPKVVRDFAASTIEATSPHIADGVDSCLVTIHLENKVGNPVSGLRSEYFRIQASGRKNFYGKVTETTEPGTYTGKFSSLTAEDKIVTVRVAGYKVDSSPGSPNTPVIITFALPVVKCGDLVLIEGTECRTSSESWDKALDGDSISIVSAGPKWQDCWAIFAFADQETKQVVKYRLATNPDVDWPSNQVSEFKMLVSSTGTNEENFTKIDEVWWNPGGWYEQEFDAINVKFVKLVLLEPKRTWRQISEFELYHIDISDQFTSEPQTANENQHVEQLPTQYDLGQNYPNPFNPETNISYQLPEAAQVTIRIYNLLGQNIRTLVSANQSAGKYTETWDGKDNRGRDVSSGIYVYRLNAISKNQTFTRAKKLMLIR